MTTTEYTPDHTVEHRPVEVLTAGGRTLTAIDHGLATPKDHLLVDSPAWGGSVDYAVRLVHRGADVANFDKLSISGARELARQLLASADAAEERLQADTDAAREEGPRGEQ